MENKNNSGMLVGILIGIIIMLIANIGLFAIGTISFKTTLNNGEISENNSQNDNEQKLKMVDYSKYIGTYINEEANSIDDISSNGGIILKITSLSKNDISFNIQCISHNAYRVADINMNDVRNIQVSNGVYSFSWFEDGWGNSGTGTISIVNNEVKLNIKVEKMSENAQWSANASNYLMHKI